MHRLRLAAASIVMAAALLGFGFLSSARAALDPTCAADAGSTINVLHAGSLTNLVRLGLGPALSVECGVTVTDQSGPAVQVAEQIKAGSLTGDVYMSADAHVNKTLMGSSNGDWVRWFLAFAGNQEVISYTPPKPLLRRSREGAPG